MISFSDYEKQIARQCWSWVRLTGMDFDEAFAEASLIFAECVQRWEPGKGAKFGTYLWSAVKRGLNSATSRARRDLYSDVIEDMALTEMTPSERYEFVECLQKLPTDARAICEMIFEDPWEFIRDTPRKSRAAIIQHLRDREWSWSRIYGNMGAIKAALQVS